MASDICICSLFALRQAGQHPASMWRLAESDFKMLQGEHGEDSVLLEYRLGLYAMCGRCQEGMTPCIK